MVIIMKRMDKGYFVHLQGYTLLSGRGTSISEAIGNLVMNHESALKLKLEWDKEDELTRQHIRK